MDKDKSRGRKHIKNKQKYKPKKFEEKHTTQTTSYNPTNLDSNWDRYEQPSDDSDNGLNTSTDFSVLASAPITQGDRFQFKSDQNLVKEIESTELPDDIFNLNLNLLNVSLGAIPFYERIGLNQDYFTEEQIKKMDEKAENKKNEFLKEISNLKIDGHREDIMSEIDKRFDQTSKITEKMQLLLTETEESNCNVVKGQNEKSEVDGDLEQWLDDILDT